MTAWKPQFENEESEQIAKQLTEELDALPEAERKARFQRLADLASQKEKNASFSAGAQVQHFESTQQFLRRVYPGLTEEQIEELSNI